MKKSQETLQLKDTIKAAVLYIAFELSNSKWKLAFSDGSKVRYKTITAGNLAQLQVEIELSKQKFKMVEDVRVVSCYEAGRDGFWIHRYLESLGIENLVVDSASLEVNRRKRRAKTDRIDVAKLMRMLLRYWGGEKQVWSVVRVPSEQDEDARHLHRSLDGLKKERTMHRNRIKGLLIKQGIKVSNPSQKKFLEVLEKVRTWNGQEVLPELKSQVVREYERLQMVEDQIKALEKEKTERLKNPDTDSLEKVVKLASLYGIGSVSSWTFVMEFFGWRQFKNRREVGALAGLTPTPYDSGKSQREQGISKAGNQRIRTLAVEISWAWLRFQPQSELSQWYMKRFGSGGKRMRRIGIVAMARKLLIDLWRYLEYDKLPEGARLKSLA
ncbi:MAG: IS110 family transposase [Planctomycetes bacterium]|nr:IS110 family transposase [Planctomycetota bacterium]